MRSEILGMIMYMRKGRHLHADPLTRSTYRSSTNHVLRLRLLLPTKAELGGSRCGCRGVKPPRWIDRTFMVRTDRRGDGGIALVGLQSYASHR